MAYDFPGMPTGLQGVNNTGSMGPDALSSGGGAAAGSSLGAIGALGGAGLSAGVSLFGSMDQQKKQKKAQKDAEEAQQSLPGHKKLSRVFDAINAWQDKKLQSMATLSQAAMDWANMMR